jgi:hypothetical protein
MMQYKVFEQPFGKIEVVKQGWSWPGFFFTVIWALVKRMWVLGCSLFAIFYMVHFFGAVFGGETEKMIETLLRIGSIVLSIVFGVNGNAWRESNLQSRGYAKKTIITAANPDGATALYLREKRQR